MGEDGSGMRVGRVFPVLIAGIAIGLLVVLSTPPEVTLPEHPDEQARGSGGADPAVLEESGSDDPLTGRIHGIVLRGEQGAPARLTLQVFQHFPGWPLRHGRADASGEFAFEGVPPGLHEVSAAGVDGVQVRRLVTVIAGVPGIPVELVLPGGEFTLRGRAVHADGRPFSGEVEVRRGEDADPLLATTRTDGRFAVSGLSAGKVFLRFHSGRTFFAEGPRLELPFSDEVLVVVDEGAMELTGRVVVAASGEPVTDAEVRIEGHDARGRWFKVRVWSAEDGRFAARTPLSDGRVPSLTVEAYGFRPWRMTGLPAGEHFEVALEPSARLTVRVVDTGSGTPVPFVPVRAIYDWMPDVKRWETFLTDRDGRVTFGSIPARTIQLFVREHGYRTDPEKHPEEVSLLTLSPEEEREMKHFVLRSAVIMGRVITASGEPVGGGSVRYKSACDSCSGRVQADGRFLIENLWPGEFDLHPGKNYLKGEVVTGTLAPGEVRELELKLEAGAWLHVQVRGADTGEPIESAWVRAEGGGEGVTDATGQVRIGPIRPGTRDGRVWINGYRAAYWEALEFAIGRPATLVVTLSRGMSVAGRVLLPDGTPAVGAQVDWANPDDWYANRQTVRSGEDGRFLMHGLSERSIHLRAEFRDGERRRYQGEASFPAGTPDAILVLRPRAKAKGRRVPVTVTDGEGRPIPKAEFTVRGRNAKGKLVLSKSAEIVNGSGELEVTGEPVDFLLYVHGARRPTSEPLPLGAAVFGPYPASVDSIEVVLPEERVMTGRVIGPDGKGLPMLTIEGSAASFPGADLVNRFPWTIRTGPDGSFRLGGLADGEVRLIVLVPAGLTQPNPVVVPAGELGVVIRLHSLVSVTVTVRDDQRQPVDNATVEVRNQARLDQGGLWRDTEEWSRSGPDGIVRFLDLPRGAPHILRVRPIKKSGLAAVRIDGWLPGDTEVTLRPGRSIAGKVVHADGTAWWCPADQLWCWTRIGGWQMIDREEGGVFHRRGLPAGRVALAWFPDEHFSLDPPDVEPDQLKSLVRWFEAGTEDIVIRVPSR